MTPYTRRLLTIVGAFVVAALFQMTAASNLLVFGAQVDLPLCAAIVGSMLCDVNTASAVGFASGVLTASLAAPPVSGFGSIVVSRTIVCFLIGWLEARIVRDSALLAPLFGVLGTVSCAVMFFAFDPQKDTSHWTIVLVGSSLYNGVVAIPLFYIMRRIAGRDESTALA